MNLDLQFAICALVYSVGLVAIGFLAGRWTRTAPIKVAAQKRRVEPVTTIVPYMVVLNGGAEKLETPAVWRRGGKS